MRECDFLVPEMSVSAMLYHTTTKSSSPGEKYEEKNCNTFFPVHQWCLQFSTENSKRHILGAKKTETMAVKIRGKTTAK